MLITPCSSRPDSIGQTRSSHGWAVSDCSSCSDSPMLSPRSVAGRVSFRTTSFCSSPGFVRKGGSTPLALVRHRPYLPSCDQVVVSLSAGGQVSRELPLAVGLDAKPGVASQRVAGTRQCGWHSTPLTLFREARKSLDATRRCGHCFWCGGRNRGGSTTRRSRACRIKTRMVIPFPRRITKLLSGASQNLCKNSSPNSCGYPFS